MAKSSNNGTTQLVVEMEIKATITGPKSLETNLVRPFIDYMTVVTKTMKRSQERPRSGQPQTPGERAEAERQMNG